MLIPTEFSLKNHPFPTNFFMGDSNTSASMEVERSHFLFSQRIKYLLELRQVFVVKPIEVVHTSLLVEEPVGGVASQTHILLNGVLLLGWQVVVNAIRHPYSSSQPD